MNSENESRKIGYIRSYLTKSTNHRRQLKGKNVDVIFEDVLSEKLEPKIEFEKLLNQMHKGDTILVPELNHLGDEMDIVQTLEWFKKSGVTVKPLNFSVFGDHCTEKELKQYHSFLIEMLNYYPKLSDVSTDLPEGKKGRGRPLLYAEDSTDPIRKAKYLIIEKLLNQDVPIKQISEGVGVKRPTIYRIKRDLELKKQTKK